MKYNLISYNYHMCENTAVCMNTLCLNIWCNSPNEHHNKLSVAGSIWNSSTNNWINNEFSCISPQTCSICPLCPVGAAEKHQHISHLTLMKQFVCLLPDHHIGFFCMFSLQIHLICWCAVIADCSGEKWQAERQKLCLQITVRSCEFVLKVDNQDDLSSLNRVKWDWSSQ